MKKKLCVLLALVLLLGLCACGASSGQKTDLAAATEESAEMSVMRNAEAPMPAEPAYGGFAMADAAAADAAVSSDLPETDPDKIIYSADATVETTGFDETLSRLEALVKEHGGWIESSSINGANYYHASRGDVVCRSASYTLRVPSDSFSTLMGTLSTLGNVPYTYVYTDNVTAQYYDTQARLTAYETQEARLLEMMEKAGSVEDIIAIEARLSELRYQIESLQSTLKNWDRQVSYSTIRLDISEVQAYTPDAPSARQSYGERLALALKNSLREIGSFLSNLLIWLVAALPVFVLLAAAGFVLCALVRLCTKKRRAKKAAARMQEDSPADSGK